MLGSSLPKNLTMSKFMGYAVQHGSAILNGCVTFLVLKGLSHFLPDQARFSQVSLVFLLFSTYLALLDLGSQTEFLTLQHRQGSRAHKLALKHLAQLRTMFVSMGMVAALLYGVLAKFSTELFAAMLIFVAALYPLIIFSIYDTQSYAAGRVGRAVTVRLARVVASGAFLSSWYFWPDQSLIHAFLIFTLSSLLMAGVFVLLWKPQRYKGDVPRGEVDRVQFRLFVRSAMQTALLSALLIVSTLLFHGFMVRQVGETQVAFLNTALAVGTPFSLFFQTYIILALPRLFNQQLESSRAYADESLKLLKNLFLMLILALGLLYLMFWAGLVEWLFGPHLTPSFTYFFWGMLGLWVAQAVVPYSAYAIYQKRQISASKIVAALALIGFPLLKFALHSWQDLGYFIFLFGYWAVFGAIFYFWLHRKTSPSH